MAITFSHSLHPEQAEVHQHGARHPVSSLISHAYGLPFLQLPLVFVCMVVSTIPVSILGSRFAMSTEPFWTPNQYSTSGPPLFLSGTLFGASSYKDTPSASLNVTASELSSPWNSRDLDLSVARGGVPSFPPGRSEHCSLPQISRVSIG